MSKVIIHCAEKLYYLLVKDIESVFTTESMCFQQIVFDHSKTTKYACDIRIQQSKRRCASHDEAKPHRSVEHQLYGYKTETSVLVNIFCFGNFLNVIGDVSNLETFCQGLSWHRHILKTKDSEIHILNK